jgi:hypothetical protein
MKYCSECERPVNQQGDCYFHKYAPVDETPGGPEEELEETVLSPSGEAKAAAPISYHLTEAAQTVTALKGRIEELQCLVRRADDRLAHWQRAMTMLHMYKWPEIDECRAYLTKALEIL